MKRVGVREIAEAAGVSIGTVDRALNGRPEISEKTRQRVLQVARELGYEPNLSARALSVGKTSARVGVCIPEQIGYFYEPLLRGVRDEIERSRYAGAEVVYRPVKTLLSDQTRAVRHLLKDGINGLILTPASPAAGPLIQEAESRHDVRVVCVASDSSGSGRSSAVSVEPRMNGMLAADLMANFVPAGSYVAVFTGMLSTEDHAKKVEGFSEVFPSRCAGGQIAAVVEGHEDEDETFAKCLDTIRHCRGMAGIYVNTANCLPVFRALAQEGAAGRIKVVTTDLFPEVAPYVRDGTVTAVIHQRPYRQGQIAARILLDHALHGQPIPAARYLNPAIVMRSNLPLFPEAGGPVRTAV